VNADRRKLLQDVASDLLETIAKDNLYSAVLDRAA
jgi:hypothetical protein